jgi:hypothetical protein
MRTKHADWAGQRTTHGQTSALGRTCIGVWTGPRMPNPMRQPLGSIRDAPQRLEQVLQRIASRKRDRVERRAECLAGGRLGAMDG